MCPIVPMFTCGFVRSNFSFAIASSAPLVKEQNFLNLLTDPKTGHYKVFTSRLGPS
jgi:hypothetical protein